MKPIEGSEFFSLAARQRLEAEKVKARRAAEAKAIRILARLACERRLRDMHTVVVEAELRVLRRLGRGPLATLWDMARSVVRRLREEDRPATLAAAEDVALAVEAEPAAEASDGAPALRLGGKEIP